jgi:uncharacterized membrane protein
VFSYAIVELYFSEFIMIKLICIYVIILLALSMFIAHIQEKDKQKQYTQDKKIDYLTLAQKIGKQSRASLYFFRKH